MDNTDIECLSALQGNPRGSWRDLSAACQIPERTVARRIQALLEGRYIRVVPELDPVLVGTGPVLHAWIRAENGEKEDVAQALARWPESQVVMAITGGSDIFAEINVRSDEQLADMVVRKLPQVHGLEHVESRIVMRSFRRASLWRIDGSPPPAGSEFPPQGRIELTQDESRLVSALWADGRASIGALAQACESTDRVVQRLLTGLIERNLLGFRVEMEPSLVGFKREAILSIQVQPGKADRIAEELAKDPHTRCLFGTEGKAPIFWHVLCRDARELWDIATNRLANLEGVINCDVSAVVKAYKRAGLLRHGPQICILSLLADNEQGLMG